MKRTLALLLALCLLCGCTARTPGAAPSPEEKPAAEETPVKEEASAPAEETPTEETPAPSGEGEEAPAQEEEEPSEEEKAAADDDAGESQSGTFYIMDSGYEITLNSPFRGIYDRASDGMYLSAVADSSLSGIISYTDDAEAVKAIEDNITVLNETLKNDDSVHDFQYDRWRDAMDLYSITFRYRMDGDEYSKGGYNYVLYRQTDEGMITVMFTCDDNSYQAPIETVFNSVLPASENAVDAPER